MKTWQMVKNQLSTVTPTEQSIIETLAQLQTERQRQGLSQRDLAQRIGMTQPQLAKIERLDSLPTLATLGRYAAGLGLTVKLSLVASPQQAKTGARAGR
ncbi:helix-turn-helix domain-containing protein [Lacticaseibacillus parakribbianus]|uniref:helix-turn-helix domain-containing protein n=1 Tax=Lacticaseibacillus parakribbianus TaxID=2970927 RepID=UPI0021CAFEFE|nr:helix-turn-helix transcriptional regulator [Lacticaseibacillus parakribbianus]